MSFANRRGNGPGLDMTTAQKSALWLLARSALDGCDSAGHYTTSSGKIAKVDVRTIVALVARGYLFGADGRIHCTDAGRELAGKL